uniref:Uncharacterized protein n=1 Tax=Avena sativa TaxID=4498 RepID=A0ACD5Z8J3_AVESA
MWDDALKENGQCWKRFCAPLLSAQEGSMMLITTRCPKVAEGVRTMESVILEGLNDDVFWKFFKLCVFGSESSDNDPELETIGRNILPKLKGSPLAAKTLGRMLKMDRQASHWNCILESELWKLPQEATDILPALRLSYMYLPFYLKRCFSFCAVYPKDFIFQKVDLSEIWVAEGFVESEDIGFQYFQDLVARSFFQESRGGYVIHDLLHDMAQKVSEHDCFILRNKNDCDKVPQNVRHIYTPPNSKISISDLLRLCKHTKLRTLFCNKMLLGHQTRSLMDQWCTKLRCIRVISCTSANELPQSIGNLKHLRYLKISTASCLRIPSAFCRLYNLQILDVKTCKIESLPNDFSNLRSLQRFVSQAFSYCPVSISCIDSAAEQAQGVKLMKNLNQFRGHLEISNVGMLSKDHAAAADLKNKKFLDRLSLAWSPPFSPKPQESPMMQNNAIEVLQVLQPPASLKSLLLLNYPGVSLPSWFQPHNINLNERPAVLDNSNDSIGTFLSLTDLTFSRCQNLSSLEHFLHPDYVPAIKKITLHNCKNLVSVPTERLGDLSFLEELNLDGCPNISSQTLVSPSLKRLYLGDCGNILVNIECCSVTKFTVSTDYVMSIQPEIWSLPALEELNFRECKHLASIGVSTNLLLSEGNGSKRAYSKLRFLNIENCPKLSVVGGLLTQEYLPTIERIRVSWCKELLSLSGVWFGGLSSLKHLLVSLCPLLNWQSGLVLPSSLRTLVLVDCGDFSACVPGCLENLTSLVLLKMEGCVGMTSIPGTIWQNNLVLHEELVIQNCPNLVSIGGAEAVAK